MHRDHALGLLGLRDHPNPDAETIKKAFRTKAMMFHPDRNPGNAGAEMMFKKINEAYQFLKDNPSGARAPHASSQRDGDINVPVDDDQLELLGKICDLMGLERNGDSYSYVLQFSTQLMSKLMYLLTFRMNDVAIGTKRKGYERMNLRMHLLANTLQPRVGRHRIRTPEYVIRHMAEALAHIDPRLVDRNVVLGAIPAVIEPIYLMLKAELEDGKEVCMDRIFYQRHFDEPLCVAFWKALNPGRSTEDAKRALNYGRSRGFFSRFFG